MKLSEVCLLIMITAVITSCDKIEPPYMITGNGIDTTTNQVQQKVLVEYFTAHRCANCPESSHQLKLLKQQYGDRLIYISIHAGYLASPGGTNYETDYRTTTGNELDAFFDVTTISHPNALINRALYNNEIVIPPPAWASAIYEQLLKNPVAAIYAQAFLQDNNIHFNAGIKPLENIDGTYMLSAFIAEDSLISYQKNNDVNYGPTPDIPDYAHRYVLRGSMNGTFGDTIFSPVALTTDSFSKQLVLPLNPLWNSQKLYVVCFIYNKETNEIIQSEISKLYTNK